jgi:ferredoxin
MIEIATANSSFHQLLQTNRYTVGWGINMAVFCFTSTGNSLYAAQKIARALSEQVEPITCETLATDDDVVGFVFPAFFWGAPDIVTHFVKNLTITNHNSYLFAVATYGNFALGAENAVRKHLGKGKPDYAAAVKMVENYLPGFKVNDTHEVHQQAEERLEQIIRDIKSRKKKHGASYTPLNSVVQRFMPANDPACDRKFAISPSCTGCGICAKACPVNNIQMHDDLPLFLHHCEHCLSCMHCCPSRAIDYGKSEGKKRYIHPTIGLQGILEFRRIDTMPPEPLR